MTTKHIFITGASQGIGEALAVRFALPDTHITLVARNREKLEKVRLLCESRGATVSVESFDICDNTKLNDFLLKSDKIHHIDILVLCAGITSTVDDDFESWVTSEKLLKTNLLSPIFAITTILPIMQKRKSGHIVLLSSLAAYYGMAYTPVYSAVKSALKTYAEALRQYLKPDSVDVSVVLPGFVKSNMSNSFLRPKPFMISSEKAADIVYKGIIKKKAYIRFPFILQIGIRLMALLPYKIADFMMKISGYGG